MRLRSSWITPANSRHSRHSVLAKGQSPPPGRAARLISGQPKEARAELLAAHATVGQLDRRPPIIERFRSMTISVVSVGKNESEIIDKLKSLLFSLLAGNLVRWKTDRKAITRWGWSRIVASCAASICGGRHPGLVVGTTTRGRAQTWPSLPVALSHRLLMPAISASNSLAAAKPVGVLCCPNNARSSPLSQAAATPCGRSNAGWKNSPKLLVAGPQLS